MKKLLSGVFLVVVFSVKDNIKIQNFNFILEKLNIILTKIKYKYIMIYVNFSLHNIIIKKAEDKKCFT